MREQKMRMLEEAICERKELTLKRNELEKAIAALDAMVKAIMEELGISSAKKEGFGTFSYASFTSSVLDRNKLIANLLRLGLSAETVNNVIEDSTNKTTSKRLRFIMGRENGTEGQ